MMDKLLRSTIGQKVSNYGHFLTMIDIGIENPSPKSHWFQIKNLLQLLLNIPNRAITDMHFFFSGIPVRYLLRTGHRF